MVYNVLILEDHKMDAELMEQYLKRSSHKFKIEWVADGEQYENALDNSEPDIILSDYRLKGYSGLDAIHYRNMHHEEVPIIIVSGTIGEEKAVEIIKEGATDFLIKNKITKRLDQTILRALKEAYEKEKRRETELKLKQSEERFRMLFKHSLDGIIIGDSQGEGKILMVNDSACDMLGYAPTEMKGRSLSAFVQSEKEEITERLKERKQKGFFRGEIEMIRKDGQTMTVEVSSSITELKDGKHRSYSIIRDISERIKAQQKLQESLKEKETLLTEVHHRVKNNLAVISGLMEMQMMEATNEELYNKLFDSQSRIKSMALTHELLYEEQNFSSIDYGSSIKQLCKSIVDTLNSEVEFKFNLESTKLNINQALPTSLILNELVTNAIRHAFNDMGNAEVEVSLKEKNNMVHLWVRDNGKGIPEDLNPKEESSMGFTLIKILAKQLNGEIDINTTNGAEVHLQFSKSQKKGSSSSIIDSKN